MSQANISYGSLKDASSEAKQVAKKLNRYADNLNSQIYRKLNNYNGSYTANVEQAKSNVNSKISDLRSRSDSYSVYAQDLLDLKNQCITTDKSVKSNVSRLTASFKSAHGIRDSKVQNTINYFLTSIGNKTPFRRWLGNKKDQFNSAKDYIRGKIKDWWNYEGGAQVVKGVALGIVEVVAGVCAFIGAFSGGALIAVIAGAVVGIITAINGIANIINECAAYRTTRNGDPATGRRRSDINTVQDYLRSSFYYADKGEQYEYNSKLYRIAGGIDIVNFVCTAITFVDGMIKFAKNLYKWTKSSMVKKTFSNAWHDIKKAFKTGNFTKIKEFAYDFKTEFLDNLKKSYTFKIFEKDTKAVDFVKHGAKLIGNYASICKTLLEKGINTKSICEISFNKIVAKNLTLIKIDTQDGESEKIKLSDITGIFDFKTQKEKFIEKLSENSNISIRIPEIVMPDLSGINNMRIYVA